jgi:hypothetical protein
MYTYGIGRDAPPKAKQRELTVGARTLDDGVGGSEIVFIGEECLSVDNSTSLYFFL